MSSQMSFFVLLVSVLAFMQQAIAVPYFTAPVGSTKVNGGDKVQIKWTDNGKAPAYNNASWGNSTIYLAAGGQNVQYKLQTLATNVSPDRHAGLYTVDKTIGPSGQYYFIRMEGTQKDTTGYPVMAFSARFTLEGMTGQFNSTVMAAATSAQGSAGPTTGGATASSSMSVSLTSSTSTTPTSPLSAAAKTSLSSSAGRLAVSNNVQGVFFVATMSIVLATIGTMMMV